MRLIFSTFLLFAAITLGAWCIGGNFYLSQLQKLRLDLQTLRKENIAIGAKMNLTMTRLQQEIARAEDVRLAAEAAAAPSASAGNVSDDDTRLWADRPFAPLGKPPPMAEPLYSHAHCTGGGFENVRDAWRARSCHYKNLCWNGTARKFVFFARADGGPATDLHVALGALNAKWATDEDRRLRFDPRVVVGGGLAASDYFVGSASEAWVLYHSMNGANVGHLIWDDFLPLFELRRSFGLEALRLRPLRAGVQSGEPLWSTCDWMRAEARKGASRCAAIARRWLRAAGVPSPPPPLDGELATGEVSTADELLRRRRSEEAEALARQQRPPTHGRELVCFPHVVAGAAPFSDHCDRGHGWYAADFEGPPGRACNARREDTHWRFRAWLLANLGVEGSAVPGRLPLPAHCRHVDGANGARGRPLVIIFDKDTQKSYGDPQQSKISKWGGVLHRLAALVRAEGGADACVLDPASISPEDQAAVCSRAAVIVSDSGGGAVSAIFLPRGAAVVLLIRTDLDVSTYGKRRKVAPLDWDLWHHLGYVRVRWFDPTGLDKAREAARRDGLEYFQEGAGREVGVSEYRRLPSERRVIAYGLRSADEASAADAAEYAAHDRLIAAQKQRAAASSAGLVPEAAAAHGGDLGAPPPRALPKAKEATAAAARAGATPLARRRRLLNYPPPQPPPLRNAPPPPPPPPAPLHTAEVEQLTLRRLLEVVKEELVLAAVFKEE